MKEGEMDSGVDIDARCLCARCTEPRTYRMKHRCRNCTSTFVALHRFGDKARTDCPKCGASQWDVDAIERAE